MIRSLLREFVGDNYPLVAMSKILGKSLDVIGFGPVHFSSHKKWRRVLMANVGSCGGVLMVKLTDFGKYICSE